MEDQPRNGRRTAFTKVYPQELNYLLQPTLRKHPKQIMPASDRTLGLGLAQFVLQERTRRRGLRVGYLTQCDSLH
jgi:hypothetical protein